MTMVVIPKENEDGATGSPPSIRPPVSVPSSARLRPSACYRRIKSTKQHTWALFCFSAFRRAEHVQRRRLPRSGQGGTGRERSAYPAARGAGSGEAPFRVSHCCFTVLVLGRDLSSALSTRGLWAAVAAVEVSLSKLSDSLSQSATLLAVLNRCRREPPPSSFVALSLCRLSIRLCVLLSFVDLTLPVCRLPFAVRRSSGSDTLSSHRSRSGRRSEWPSRAATRRALRRRWGGCTRC